MKRSRTLICMVVALCAVSFSTSCEGNRAEPVVHKNSAESLPSWNDSAAKSRVQNFVRRVTQESGPDFVPVKDRIATFDNDGTLWAEQPVVESLFVMARLKAYAERNPAVRNKQPFKAFLEKDKQYLASLKNDALFKALLEVSAII